MHKATLIFSLIFLAVAGSAQTDGGAYTSGQPQTNSSSVTPTLASGYPSGSPISIPPANSTGLRHCHPHSSIPTDYPLSSGMADGSPVSKPIFSTTISGCRHHSESTLPTGTADSQPYSGGPLPTANTSFVSKPTHSITPNGSQPGNYTASSEPSSTGPPQQDPPISTASSYVGRRRFVRRQV